MRLVWKPRKAATVELQTRRPWTSCLLVLFFLMSASPAGAWGREGHEIIGKVAEAHLAEPTRRAALQLLSGQALSAVAYWADEVRDARPETMRWHFVNVPRNAPRFDATRDCTHTLEGDCTVAAIHRARVAIANTSRSSEERAEALKFLVHFIGDLHQPLHCADNNDRGGNDVAVVFFRTPTNLHAVWDGGLIQKTGASVEAYVSRLLAWLKLQNQSALAAGTVEAWANECHSLARRHAYRLPEDRVLAGHYYDRSIPVVDAQLSKAGLRLGRMLNELLK